MSFIILPIWSIGIIHGPYLQNLNETEVTIVWISDKPSVGWLELAQCDSSDFYGIERQKYFDTKIGLKKISKVHSVKITDLKPKTRYRYRVCVQEVTGHVGHKVYYGDVASTDVFLKKPLSFMTNDISKNEISFALLCDIHGNTNTFEQLVKQCDLHSTDLFLFAGDMVTSMNNQEQIFGGFMDKAVDLFAGSVPMYYCRGNHETRGPLAHEFQTYFNPEEDNLFYMFRQGPVCFVILDCGEDKSDSDLSYYGITAYDEYRSLQQKWLEKILNSDLYKDAPFKIIVCHIPPLRNYDEGGWHGELDIRNKFIPLLEKAKPDVFLSGHFHTHKIVKDEVSFPIIINSNNTLLKAKVNDNKMDIKIHDLNGEVVEHFIVEK